jgi:hypothetical protein
MSFNSEEFTSRLTDKFYEMFIVIAKRHINIYKQQGRDIRNLSYLSKQLQENPDVISAISVFLKKDDPYTCWKTWDEYLKTLA